MARALRRAVAGTAALAVLAVALASLMAFEFDQTEASASAAVRATPIIAAGPELTSNVPIAPVSEPSAAALAAAVAREVPEVVVEAPELAGVEVEPGAVDVDPFGADFDPFAAVGDEALRSTRTAAVADTSTSELTSGAGDASEVGAATAEERLAALVAAAAARDEAPAIVEPAWSVIGRHGSSPPLATGEVIEATVSFYYCLQGNASGGDGGGFCGPMRDGTVVYQGAAACAYTYLGQRFRIVGDPTGRVYTCHDTGNLVDGRHRDIFFYFAEDGWAWLSQVGTPAILEIVE
jgi:hypothetical protein